MLRVTIIMILMLCAQPLSAASLTEANSVRTDVNTIDVVKLASQALDAMTKLTSYESRMIFFDYGNENLKSAEFMSVAFEFKYEKPNKYEVHQGSMEEKAFDHWISIDKTSYSEMSGSWFKDEGDYRIKTNCGLSFEKFKPLLKKCKFKYSGTEQSGERECFVIKGKLDNSNSEWPLPKGKIENEVSFNILKTTKQVVKVSVKVQGSDEKGKKIDTEMQQWYRSYNKTFNITKPAEIAG